jgi:hypothetical protein
VRQVFWAEAHSAELDALSSHSLESAKLNVIGRAAGD